MKIKVAVPNLVIVLSWTFIFEWYVVKFASKNGYRKDVCLKEIALCAQNMINNLSLIANIIEGTSMTV